MFHPALPHTHIHTYPSAVSYRVVSCMVDLISTILYFHVRGGHAESKKRPLNSSARTLLSSLFFIDHQVRCSLPSTKQKSDIHLAAAARGGAHLLYCRFEALCVCLGRSVAWVTGFCCLTRFLLHFPPFPSLPLPSLGWLAFRFHPFAERGGNNRTEYRARQGRVGLHRVR